jgi:hypothetical protein
MQSLNNLQRVVQWYIYYLRTLWSLVRISTGALFCHLQLTIVKCIKMGLIRCGESGPTAIFFPRAHAVKYKPNL